MPSKTALTLWRNAAISFYFNTGKSRLEDWKLTNHPYSCRVNSFKILRHQHEVNCVIVRAQPKVSPGGKLT